LRCDDVFHRLGRVGHGLDDVVGAMNVRLFASLREIAGSTHVEATGHTVRDVVADLSSRYGERFAQIADVGSVVVNGERAGPDTPIAEGDEVALLPPVSGGA
jgi:MoaD family protein